MVVSINLPKLVGTRDAAGRLLDELDIAAELTGDTVHIIARNLSVATSSFTDQLLIELEQRGPSQILVISAPSDFRKLVDDTVQLHRWDNVRVATQEELAAL
jgi:hypothetical protein